ncbi:hypothetical protein MASR2M44_13870 [Bacteroidota bacterium]
MQPKTIEYLSWDSEFFGFPIGKLTLDTRAEFEAWKAQFKPNREKLLYVFSNEPLAQGNDSFKFVDEKRTYSLQFGNEAEESKIPEIRSLMDTRNFQAQLETLTLRSGLYSRFKLDTLFPKGSFEKFYLTWLENSQKGLIADELLAFMVADEPAGFVTLALKKDGVSIGLIAVDEQVSGKGIGKSLLQAARQWAIQQGKSRIEVVTQGQNRIACRFYESAGYSLIQTQFVYHYWL